VRLGRYVEKWKTKGNVNVNFEQRCSRFPSLFFVGGLSSQNSILVDELKLKRVLKDNLD
jgi:hypothetical protein